MVNEVKVTHGYTELTKQDVDLIERAIIKFGSKGQVSRVLGYSPSTTHSTVMNKITRGQTKQIKEYGLLRLYKEMGEERK